MANNPYQAPENAPHAGVAHQSPSSLGLRLLSCSFSALLAIPLIVAGSFLITDLFYFNRYPEYMRLYDSFQSGFLFLDFMFDCIMEFFYLALPLVVFAIVTEFLCKSSQATLFAGVCFGVLIGGLRIWYSSTFFTLVSKWYAIESCLQFLVPIVVLTFLTLLLGTFRRNRAALEM